MIPRAWFVCRFYSKPKSFWNILDINLVIFLPKLFLSVQILPFEIRTKLVVWLMGLVWLHKSDLDPPILEFSCSAGQFSFEE
jgi:hypothetical protein